MSDWGFSLGQGVGVLVRGGLVARAPFVPEQLITADTTFATATGWTAGTGITISGGTCTSDSTGTTILDCLAGNYSRVPVSGEHVFLEFDLLAYTNGNIGPRIRWTDGTFTYFYGDQAGNGPLAGGDADVGFHQSPTITIPAGKTFDRVMMRTTVRSTVNNWQFDNLKLWTSENARSTPVWPATP